jgi:putative aldouronate transport system permease protein
LLYWLDNWTLLLLAVPGVALIFALRYIPMFGIVVAFQEHKAASGFFSPWVGFQNFRLLVESPVLGRLVWNTVFLNTLFIGIGTFFAVLIALLLNEVRLLPFKSVAQSLIFLPFFMGWTLVAMILYGMIDPEVGTLNMALEALGREPISFTNRPEWWPWILTTLRVWKGTGSGCVIYLAALAGIDPQLYEAAAMDGASRLQRIWRINLPLLVPTIILMTLLAIGTIFFGDVGMIYAVVGNRGPLFPTTDVIDTYVIRSMQNNTNFGISTAIGLSQSVLGFLLVFGSNWLARTYSRRRGEDYALF